MIPLRRGQEPQELTQARKVGLEAARSAFNEYGPGSTELEKTLKGYGVAKAHLYKVQHRKCAYCERKPGFREQPVEHYRPKAKAWRHLRGQQPSIVDHERYWWLTWNWNNLLFACTTCNGRSAKSNYFPLVQGTDPLPAPLRGRDEPLPSSIDSESPLLLDPGDTRINPFEHMKWVVTDYTLPPKLWTWQLVNLTPAGAATIHTLKLRELEDEVNDHYKTHIEPGFQRIRAAAQGRSIKRAQAEWRTLLRLTRPTECFSAAVWWQLETLRKWTVDKLGIELEATPQP